MPVKQVIMKNLKKFMRDSQNNDNAKIDCLMHYYQNKNALVRSAIENNLADHK